MKPVHERTQADLLAAVAADPKFFHTNPGMHGPEVVAMERILRAMAADLPCVNVLEWGAGGSTVYFTRFLAGLGVNYTWTSVEHDIQWAKALEPHLDTAFAQVCLFTCDGDPRQNRKLPMDDYVNFPRSLHRQWDLILVDGRRRRRCLLEAPRCLQPHGVCLLHDAERVYYHCAMEVFPIRRFLAGTRLWAGQHLAGGPWVS